MCSIGLWAEQPGGCIYIGNCWCKSAYFLGKAMWEEKYADVDGGEVVDDASNGDR